MKKFLLCVLFFCVGNTTFAQSNQSKKDSSASASFSFIHKEVNKLFGKKQLTPLQPAESNTSPVSINMVYILDGDSQYDYVSRQFKQVWIPDNSFFSPITFNFSATIKFDLHGVLYNF